VILGLLAGIVFVAFLAEAAMGFGSTVLAVTLGAHFLPLDQLLPALAPLNMILSTVILLRSLRSLDGRVLLLRILPAMGAGLVVGLALFRLQHLAALKLAFGLFVVALAALELARLFRAAPARQLARPAALGLLAVGGFIHGLFGSGGPMVVYVASRELPDKAAFRATLSALWLLMNVILLANYISLGLFDRRAMELAIPLFPAMLAALVLGDLAHGRLREGPFRVAMYGLLLFAGAALALRTIPEMRT
jgi:uncharacterized membrane protein YfcA